MKGRDAIATVVVGLLSLIGFGTAIGAYLGLVAMLGWNWFVAPAFAVGPIGFWHAFGISAFALTVLTAVKGTAGNASNNKAESPLEAFVLVFSQSIGTAVGVSLSLGLMAIIHAIMEVCPA